MNYDEFAFLNQQLAGMLRGGIPLEGALKQLSATMQSGSLRGELEQLGADLAKGVPLREALPRRRLPEFYVTMVRLGAQGNDLPGMLTLLADYYRRRYSLWSKLQGLLVYPAIVLVAVLSLSLLFYWLYHSVLLGVWGDLFPGRGLPADWPALLWMPVVWIAGLAIAFTLALSVPSWRDWLRWRLPGFRESNLSQFASSMRLLLVQGGQLGQAIELLQTLEAGDQVRRELERWRQRLAAGHGKFEEFAGNGRFFPPLFLWLVGQGGEDLAGGFGRAAEVYFERAKYRVELLLYAALPVAVVVLGGLICLQVTCMCRLILAPLAWLGGGVGDGP
jgi:type II secretory pathway component PulF